MERNLSRLAGRSGIHGAGVDTYGIGGTTASGEYIPYIDILRKIDRDTYAHHPRERLRQAGL